MTKGDDIKKYTNEELVRLTAKFNGKDFSQSLLYKHFRQLIRNVEWLNGKG